MTLEGMDAAVAIAQDYIDRSGRTGDACPGMGRVSRALLALHEECGRLREMLLRGPLTEQQVTAALDEGHMERRVAQGDNAWTRLHAELARLKLEASRIRPVYEAACEWRDQTRTHGANRRNDRPLADAIDTARREGG